MRPFLPAASGQAGTPRTAGREQLFEEYWETERRDGGVADIVINCRIVPSDETLKAMLRSAYMTGWLEALRVNER
jgi:hypothetical protein